MPRSCFAIHWLFYGTCEEGGAPEKVVADFFRRLEPLRGGAVGCVPMGTRARLVGIGVGAGERTERWPGSAGLAGARCEGGEDRDERHGRRRDRARCGVRFEHALVATVGAGESSTEHTAHGTAV